MRTCALSLVALVALVALVELVAPARGSPAGEKYTNRYDHIDIDAILANKRTLRVYVNCLLEKGDCPPEAKELRAHIPEALHTACDKCTPSQKNLLRKAIRYLRANDRPTLELITKHYDPEDKYRQQFSDFVDSSN